MKKRKPKDIVRFPRTEVIVDPTVADLVDVVVISETNFKRQTVVVTARSGEPLRKSTDTVIRPG